MFERSELCRSPLLGAQAGLFHGFYGMPEPPMDGAASPEYFDQQIKMIAQQLSIAPNRMIGVTQLHSAKVRMVAASWGKAEAEADALVTDQPELALVIKTADCAPVLLVDPQAGVVGAAHAGWRGALAGILEQTVMHMTFLGAQRERIVAAIGPCIAPVHYEVGTEFQDGFIDASEQFARFFTQDEGEKPHFDLGSFCQEQLSASGIFASELLPIDTFDEKNRFFSYRRARGQHESGYGRNISVICLPKHNI